MRKLTILSLALLLAIGLFVTGCKKKTLAPENDKKAEVEAPAEK